MEQFWESQATVGRPGTAPAAPQPFHKTSLAAPLVQYLVFRPLLLVVVDPDIFSPNFVNQVHLPAFRQKECPPCMTTVPWQLRIMGELIIPRCTNPPLYVQGARPLVRLFSNCSTYVPLGICPRSKFISAAIDLFRRSPGEAG